MKQQDKNDIKLGKFIALILRHHPEKIGLTLDKNGWCSVNELIDKINRHGRNIDMETLERIVKENNKKRYSFNEDKTKIRANQGHSIKVDVELKEMDPPEYLYHGTATKSLESIQKDGLKPMNRLYVHLSKDIETAINVGNRHGEPVVLKIKSEEMHRDGFKFYLSENGVWLTKMVPKKYFEELEK